jgi:hypothetical protein
MAETIDEAVSVDLVSSHQTHTAHPWCMVWRGRRYVIKTVGLHHTVREGRTLLHVFTVSDGTSSFRLTFNTESLQWRLLEMDGTYGQITH